MKRSVLALATAAPVLALPLAFAAPASAATGMTYQATLNPITANHVTGSGMATVTLNGTTITVDETVNGLLAGVPHAQHIHIVDSGKGMCPTSAQASDHNGHQAVSTVDGQPAYGMIHVSLTTSGDTSPQSGLAVKRFPTGSSFHYTRTITISSADAQAIKDGQASIVVHGIDYNGNGKWDNVLGASQLDKSLPLEATAPALCGTLVSSQMSSMPSGGAATGGGSTAGIEDAGLFAVGGLALLGAFGGVAYSRRSSHRA